MSAQTTEEKIINAAVREFSRYGFDGARMDRIAKTAKVNKAMIYYHYKGKEALYEKILSTLVDGIFSRVNELIPDSAGHPEQLKSLIRGYAEYIYQVDEDYFKIIIREIATGGKYFKKIAVPGLIMPVYKLISGLFARGSAEGFFSGLRPEYTMVHIVGSVVFFNLMRITLKDTPVHDILLRGDYKTDYVENLIAMLSSNIFAKKGGEL